MSEDSSRPPSAFSSSTGSHSVDNAFYMPITSNPFTGATATVTPTAAGGQAPLSDLTQYINPDVHNTRVQNAIGNHIQGYQKKSRADTYKTVMCQAWLESMHCSFGENCKFAHGEQELRPVKTQIKNHLKYKTKLCDKYTTSGICPYGSRCLFIHPAPTKPVKPGTALTDNTNDPSRSIQDQQLEFLRQQYGPNALHDVIKKDNQTTTPSAPRTQLTTSTSLPMSPIYRPLLFGKSQPTSGKSNGATATTDFSKSNCIYSTLTNTDQFQSTLICNSVTETTTFVPPSWPPSAADLEKVANERRLVSVGSVGTLQTGMNNEVLDSSFLFNQAAESMLSFLWV